MSRLGIVPASYIPTKKERDLYLRKLTGPGTGSRAASAPTRTG